MQLQRLRIGSYGPRRVQQQRRDHEPSTSWLRKLCSFGFIWSCSRYAGTDWDAALRFLKPFGKTGGHMSHCLNSLKGIIWGTTIGVIKGDTRS